MAGVENGENRSFDNLNDGLGRNNNNQSLPVSTSNAATTPDATTTLSISRTPFAKIDAVANLSPAKTAGLQAGDLLLQFGSIDLSNHRNLTGLMPVVTAAADAQQAVSLTVLRQQEDSANKVVVQLDLVPKPWPGRGLIGCYIIPYSDAS